MNSTYEVSGEFSFVLYIIKTSATVIPIKVRINKITETNPFFYNYCEILFYRYIFSSSLCLIQTLTIFLLLLPYLKNS